MKKEYRLFTITSLLIISGLLLFSCARIDLYEKVSNIPGHEWKSNYTPQFEFDIKDTAAPYQLYLIFRHNEKYSYNNLWLNLYAQEPGKKAEKFTLEFPLATTEKGWMASAMDDIYEHRIVIPIDLARFNFNKTGKYVFRLENIMREDPLQNVMGIGVRVERK